MYKYEMFVAMNIWTIAEPEFNFIRNLSAWINFLAQTDKTYTYPNWQGYAHIYIPCLLLEMNIINIFIASSQPKYFGGFQSREPCTYLLPSYSSKYFGKRAGGGKLGDSTPGKSNFFFSKQKFGSLCGTECTTGNVEHRQYNLQEWAVSQLYEQMQMPIFITLKICMPLSHGWAIQISLILGSMKQLSRDTRACPKSSVFIGSQ